MCDIINNHIKLNPKWSGNDLQLWNNWGISIASGTLRMDPLEDMLEKNLFAVEPSSINCKSIAKNWLIILFNSLVNNLIIQYIQINIPTF